MPKCKAATALLLVLSFGGMRTTPAFAQDPNALGIRLSFQAFIQNPDRVQSLRHGISVMRQRDSAPKDSAEYRTSWQYWAAMHSYYGAQSQQGGPVADVIEATPVTLRSFFDGVTDLDPPMDPPGLAQKVWDGCQHGTRFFLPWHRMYLFFFERVLRSAAGDPNLRLPYWDYTDPSQLLFPPAFALQEVNGQRNSLFDPRRTAQDVTLDGRATNIDRLLNRGTFQIFQSNLENGVHGYVHCTLGNACVTPLMGKVPAAAADPIFWLHHANLDRLWECWTRRFGTDANPLSDTTWTGQPFDFINENGDKVSMTVGELFDPAGRIDYTYDRVLNCTRMPLPPAHPIISMEAAAHPATITSTQNIAIDQPTKNVGIKLPSAGPKATAVMNALGGAAPNVLGAELILDGISAEAAPGVVLDVYLAKKTNPSQREYVGTLSFFGAGEHGHTHHTQTRSFDVTNALRALVGGSPAGQDIDVIFDSSLGMPTMNPDDARARFQPQAKVRVQSIELRVRSR